MLLARRTIREGVAVGLIGYASVAVFYTGFDVLAAPGTLYTVDLLDRVFRGLRDPGILFFPLQRDTAVIVWYNAVHLVIALTIGLIVTNLVNYAERHPPRVLPVLLAIVAGFVVTVLAVGMFVGTDTPRASLVVDCRRQRAGHDPGRLILAPTAARPLAALRAAPSLSAMIAPLA